MTTSPDPGNRARLGEVAVRYARHGWPVVPLTTPGSGGCSCGDRSCGSPGKHPRIREGLRNASADPQQVRRWWSRWPEANIGVRTGAPSGLVVVDVDLPEGPASLADLERRHDRLPATCEQRTGSGGRQLLFAHPGEPVRNRTGVVAGIDVRADGGYIVVPPSRHASGDRYRWTARLAPADPPGWLLELVAKRDRTPTVARTTAPVHTEQAGPVPRRYADAAMRGELTRLAAAVEGTRNDTLNRAAFNLGQLVAGGLLDRDQVAVRLEQVAGQIGLGQAETRRTIASGLDAGLEHPRGLPLSQPARRAGPIPTPVRRRGPRRR